MLCRVLLEVILLSVYLSYGASNGNIKDRRYYCDGECDVVRQRCSCRPSCGEDRNCCTDYQESCNGESSWKDTRCSTVEETYCPDGYADPPPLVVLSIDGYRDIYFNRNYTPTIAKLASCGVKTPYMRSAYPTKTFPSHYTIATGLYPESHGIISNTIYDHEREMKFRPGRKDSFSSHWWGGEPIWVTASNQGLKTATYFWPGSEVNITRYPDYYNQYNASIPLEERVYQLFDWLDLPQESRPSLVMLYNDQVDAAGHKDGPFGDLVNESLTVADNMVEMIMNGLRDRDLETCVNFIVVSDHGMAPLDCTNKLTYLEDYGLNFTEISFDIGAFGRIGKSIDKSLWRKYNPVEIKKKLECKRETAHWEAFLKQEYLPKRYHYANNEWIEDVHLVMDDEWWVGTRDDPDCDPGGHGYDGSYTDMRAFFTAHGSAFKRGYERRMPFENIELYNLFTDILGLVPVPNNGTVGSLYDILLFPPDIERNTNEDWAVFCPFYHESQWNCPSCQGGSSAELAMKLNFGPDEEHQLQDNHLPFGMPEISRLESKYCNLTQGNYISAFDHILSIPLISSFVLIDKDQLQMDGNDSVCAQRDIRVDNGTTFFCSLSDTQESNVTFTFLFPPSLARKEDASACKISSNLIPVYKPFRKIWDFLTQNLIKWENSYSSICVQVGPIFDYNYDGHADSAKVLRSGEYATRGSAAFSVPIPSHFFFIVGRCRNQTQNETIQQCSESLEDVEFLSFVIPNYKELPCHKEGDPMKNWLPKALSRHSARIKDVELLTGISFFSKWMSNDSSQEHKLSAIRKKLDLPEISGKWMNDFLTQESTVDHPEATRTPEVSTTSSTASCKISSSLLSALIIARVVLNWRGRSVHGL